MKRVAFVISSQHYIPHGGIGQFAKSFTEMANSLGWVVDMILDKAPNRSDFTEYMESICGNIEYPANPLTYSKQQLIHAFTESYNLEKMANFRDSMMKALQSNLYDMIVVNSPDAIIPIYGLGIHEYVDIVFYTHNGTMIYGRPTGFKGTFSDAHDYMVMKAGECPGVTLATQTNRNAMFMIKRGLHNTETLPMPLTEQLLMLEYTGEKSGVLFIGRWEDGKNPEVFIDVIRKTKLPAKVMTSEKSAKKFEAALKEIGVDYDIRVQIIGKEKCDFIRSSKVAVMPSKSESFSFGMFETMYHVPCVVLEEYDWWENFPKNHFAVASKDKIAEVVAKIYQKNFVPSPDLYRKYQKDAANSWQTFADNFTPKQSNSNAATILKKDNLYYKDHIAELNRFASIEDVISVLANRHKFKVEYTKHNTWLSKEGKPPADQGSKPSAGSLEDFFND
ncbi:hypothetical protein [Synechococcus phage BUCT-ZZ01]|nr:hypothetical protein [Synechococcus phage BUCT-ZZ01]